MQNISKEELLKPEKMTAMTFFTYAFFIVLTGLSAAVWAYSMVRTFEPPVKKVNPYVYDNKGRPVVEQRPDDSHLLTTIGSGLTLSFGGWFGYALLLGALEQRRRRILLEHGVFGEARVLKYKLDDDEEEAHAVKLELEIRLEGRPPYKTKGRFHVHHKKLEQVQVGSTVRILAAPPGSPARRGALELVLN